MATRKDLSPRTSYARRGFAYGCPVLMAALLVLGASGCGDEDADQAEANLDLWRKRGPASYTYIVNHVCFCAGVEPVRVVVEDRVATGATGMDTGAAREDRRRTMNELFEEVLQIIEREPDDFRAEYHAELGYLLEARVDYIQNAVDDELSIVVSCFEADTSEDACPSASSHP